MISLRLQKLASLIPENAKIINVGTDHGLLEIYLAETKNVNSVGIDISYPCVLKARENVLKSKFKNKIDIICNDGLKNINLNNEIITISGLGTHTILDILKNVTNNDIVVQSNNNLYSLRKELYKKGYYIDKEEVIYEKRWYVIIYFKKGHKKYSNFNLYLGPTIKEKDYINYLYSLNIKKLNKIPKRNFIKRYRIKRIIRKLKNCSN